MAVLGAACNGVAVPTPAASPAATPVVTPGAPTPGASAVSWSVYTSEIKQFSLQLPSDWTVEPGIPTEGILLQIDGGQGDALLLLEDVPHQAETFRSYAQRYFEAALADDPEALQFIEFEAGPAARVAFDAGAGMNVQYLFPPNGGSSKVLSFSWEHATANPVWAMIAERFNPHSPQLIIPFGTPRPASPGP